MGTLLFGLVYVTVVVVVIVANYWSAEAARMASLRRAVRARGPTFKTPWIGVGEGTFEGLPCTVSVDPPNPSS